MSEKRGFTLVEIMVVVTIIGTLAAIAIPMFTKARQTAQRDVCINNLRQLDSAKDQYATEYGGNHDTLPTWDQILPYIKDGATKLICPSYAGNSRSCSNSYRINAIKDPAECLILPGTATEPDHCLPHK